MLCVLLTLVSAPLCWGQSIYEAIEQIKAETEAQNARTNYLAFAVAILLLGFLVLVLLGRWARKDRLQKLREFGKKKQ